MALIKCKECGKEISDKSDKCPHCGAPLDPTAESLKSLGSGMQSLGVGCSGCATFLIIVGIVVWIFASCSR